MEMLSSRREGGACLKYPFRQDIAVLLRLLASLAKQLGDSSVLPHLADTGFEDLELRSVWSLVFLTVFYRVQYGNC